MVAVSFFIVTILCCFLLPEYPGNSTRRTGHGKGYAIFLRGNWGSSKVEVQYSKCGGGAGGRRKKRAVPEVGAPSARGGRGWSMVSAFLGWRSGAMNHAGAPSIALLGTLRPVRAEQCSALRFV